LLLSFRSREIRGGIAPQICFQEILGFGQRDLVITFALNFNTQLRAAALVTLNA
jgi:hypothetical protein